jgi:hypothetical protein
LLLAALAFVLAGPVPYTAPSGDLDLDGKVDVSDLQCEILLFYQWTLQKELAGNQCTTPEACVALYGPGMTCRPGFNKDLLCLPSCLSPAMPLGKDPGISCEDPAAEDDFCLGTVQRRSADMNCDGELTSQDFLFLVAVIMGSLGGPDTPDLDGDGQLNSCDPDMDGDADPDSSDCAPANGEVSVNAVEACNNQDDDCDGLVDEEIAPVTCGVSFCQHSQVACIDGAPNPCDPFLGAVPEVCNGLDDDCSGKIDDGPDFFLCSDDLGAPQVNSVSCVKGSCVASECILGWHDMNLDVSDGCECSQDAVEEVTLSCDSALDMKTLADGQPGSTVVVSGNEPAGDGDWYRFLAQDTDEGQTDTFHVRVRFLDNPNDSYVFDAYWGACKDALQICTAMTDVEWFTDFSTPGAKAGPPAVLGPWAVGGGEANCRTDPDHTLTPDNFGDDTGDDSHQCRDNSKDVFVRVYVAPGKKPTCASYKIEMSNGKH